ncbi:Nn.00g109350.m01.CDS01 [Neocucurbitaria sp. VM-36]
MATISQPKRHTSVLFNRHHGDRHKARSVSPQEHNRPTIFEGTDAVAQNRKVAVDRIIEVHNALEQIVWTEAATAGQTASPCAISTDSITIDSNEIPLPDAEVRAFKYFLRAWDPSAPQDPEFDEHVKPSKLQFEKDASKHFFRRIALWHQSEVLRPGKDKSTKDAKKKKEKEDSALGKLWMVEKDRPEHGLGDRLKEVTTQEGLAQLLWTLLHDPNKPLPRELSEECTEAVKKKYGIYS